MFTRFWCFFCDSCLSGRLSSVWPSFVGREIDSFSGASWDKRKDGRRETVFLNQCPQTFLPVKGQCFLKLLDVVALWKSSFPGWTTMVSTQSDWPQTQNVSSTVLEARVCSIYLACLSTSFVLVFNPGHGEIELLSHMC